MHDNSVTIPIDRPPHQPRRPLRIRAGEFGFEDLMQQVEAKLSAIETLYAQSDLPKPPTPSKQRAY